MRRIDLLSGIFGCLIFLLSCTSQNSISPKVQFLNPDVNTLHDLTTDLIVEIDISDDVLLKEYKFWLESESGWEYFSEKKEVNKNNHRIYYRFDLSKNVKSYFTIHIEAIDNDDNKTSEKLKVNTL